MKTKYRLQAKGLRDCYKNNFLVETNTREEAEYILNVYSDHYDMNDYEIIKVKSSSKGVVFAFTDFLSFGVEV